MIKDIKFYNEVINGTDFLTGVSKPYLHGNIGDRVKAVIEFETQLILESSSTNIFTVSAGTVQRSVGSFIEDGIFPQQRIALTEQSQVCIARVGVVDDGYFTYTVESGSISDGDYPDTFQNLTISVLDSFGAIYYRFGIIENDEPVNYLSKYNSKVQEWFAQNILPATSVSMSNKLIGVEKDGSINCYYKSNNNGVHTIEVSHIFRIPPVYAEEYEQDFDDGTVPTLFLNQSSLKYVFQAELRYDVNNPNNILIEEFSRYKGAVGWYDETINGSTPNYSIDSVSFKETFTNIELDGIKPDVNTTVTIVLDGTVSTNTAFALNIVTARKESNYINSSSDFDDTFLFDSLYVKANGGTAGANIIKTLTVTYGAQTTIVAKIQYSAAQLASIDLKNEDFILSLSVCNQSLSNSDKCTLLVQKSAYDYTTDIAGLFDWTSCAVFAHNDTVNGKTDYKGWAQDGLRIEYSGTINNDLGASLTAVRAGIVAYNPTTKDRFTISEVPVPIGNPTVDLVTGAQYFSVNTNRGFYLASDDPFNEVSLTTVSAGVTTVIEGAIGIKVSWQDWLSLNGVPASFYDTSKPNNGLNQLVTNYYGNGYRPMIAVILELTKNGIKTDYARFIELSAYNYDEDDNVTAEWSASVEVFDLDDNSTGTNIDTTRINKIISTFTPNSGSTSDYDNLVAVVRIEKKNQPNEAVYEFSSLRDTFTGNVLKPLVGQTNLILTDNSTDVTAECYLDGRMLSSGEYYINARLFTEYSGTLTPIMEFVLATHVSGDWTITIVAKDSLGDPLSAGCAVTIEVEHGSTLIETLSGIIGDDISSFTTNISPVKSFIAYSSGTVTDGGAIVFDKLNWAGDNELINTDADNMTLTVTANDRGFTSSPDDIVLAVKTTTGLGQPLELVNMAGDILFSDYANSKIRRLIDELYTVEIGSLTNAFGVGYDEVNQVVYAASFEGYEVRSWDSTNRKDLGGTGIGKLSISTAHKIHTIFVDNGHVNSGYADIWTTTNENSSSNKLLLHYKNGTSFTTVNFTSLIDSIDSNFVLKNIISDANGHIYVTGYLPSFGNILLKLIYGSGNYYSALNWTIVQLLESNGNGYVNGDGQTAQMFNPDAGIEIIGYDNTIGLVSGTYPMFLLSDYSNACYRLYTHNGGVSPTESLNWSMSTPSYCGTQGVTTYSFSTTPEYGNVRGTVYIGTTLYGCGEGTPTRVLYKVTNFGNTGSDESFLLFGGNTGYLEQTAY